MKEKVKTSKVALLVMPRSSSAWNGSEALWITVAGWASAAQRKFGKALVLTTDKISSPLETYGYPIKRAKNQRNKGFRMASILPAILVSFLKDIWLWKSSMNKSHYNYEIPADLGEVALVWEHHDLFPGIGYKLTKKYNAPYVVYVHAPQIWEAKKWGVKRPLWGRILEKVESRNLKRADIVACVSEQVSEKLIEMGIPKEKILVSPMAVDAQLFEGINSEEISEKYKLNDKFVIGWIGSFRSFHGLDLLVEVFKLVHEKIKNARLVLVGDGIEKEKIAKLVIQLGLEDVVVFAGKKSFLEIPAYVDSFDVAVVSARSEDDFHYSPLKLREYLGAGKATLAPNAGEIPNKFIDDLQLMLYKVGDISGTAEKIIKLSCDEEKRNKLGMAGKKHILLTSTWDMELDKIYAKIRQ